VCHDVANDATCPRVESVEIARSARHENAQANVLQNLVDPFSVTDHTQVEPNTHVVKDDKPGTPKNNTILVRQVRAHISRDRRGHIHARAYFRYERAHACREEDWGIHRDYFVREIWFAGWRARGGAS
jgi:hypothetical protein